MSRTIKIVVGILLMLSISAVANSKLEGHWAKQEIDLKFMELYFPSLVQNDYHNFAPNGYIESADFQYALSGLLEVYGFEPILVDTRKKALNRKEATVILGRALVGRGLIELQEDLSNPFLDLQQLSSLENNYILNLNASGLIRGYSPALFVPKSPLTQSQAIILLQRTEKLLAKDNLPFVATGTTTSYSCQEEGLQVEEGKEKLTLRITRMFPTPGYSTVVKRIARVAFGQYQIHTAIEAPAPDAILPQVITYQTITVELPKKVLGEAPYTFKVLPEVVSHDLWK